MKLSNAQQESITALLTRIYGEIHDIEVEYQLIAGGEDFRPRIEHFHDAIRAYSSQGNDQANHPRLAVAELAYDLKALRYIISLPLASFKPDFHIPSPSVDMVAMHKGLVVKRPRPDRALKERISELYQTYAVLYAALLKPNADRDYLERVDHLNQDVAELHTLIQGLESLREDKNQIPKVMNAIHHIDEDALRLQLLNFMQKQKFTQKNNLSKLMVFIKEYSTSKDKEIADIEESHMQYVMSQLAIFENSADLLKKMAAQGMNLIGKFVESAIAESKRFVGR